METNKYSENYCTNEAWTLKQIFESLSKKSMGKRKIVIPMFQRGKRWDVKKEDTFIDSLEKNYPIGTLLFYHHFDGEQQVYTLIDGLQRATTIKKYLSSPTKYFKINKLSNDSLEWLYGKIICNGDVKAQKEMINNTMLAYIQNLNTFDDFEISVLFENLTSFFPTLEMNTNLPDFRLKFSPQFKKIKENCSKLENVTIPVIVYNGDESTLPNIFERINSKGVALTEYEIYAASWPREKFKIQNDEIITKILSKYDCLNDDDYEVDKYDRNELRINKVINAFEYTFGFSKWICSSFDILNFYKNLSMDEANPVGFQLLNACFNSTHSEIKNVYKIILKNKNKLDKLEEAICSSIKFVEKCIANILKFKANTRTDKTKILHSQYQIMSLIAFTFRQKYNENFQVKDNWREKEKILKNNFWKYYVYDILTKHWGEGGTNKIHTYNLGERYFTDISKEQFATAFDSYVADCFGRKETKKIPNPIDKDFVILNTIYLNIFTAQDQLNTENFDIEHIAPKEQMKKIIALCKTANGLPISHISNLCYLPEYTNRGKGTNNFYQDKEYLRKSFKNQFTTDEEKLKFIETKFSFTKFSDLEWMSNPEITSDFNKVKVAFEQFLNSRSSVLKKLFLDSINKN